MSKFSICTKNARMRAESDDGETITLYLWDSQGFTAMHADHIVIVKLADLRQIVSHFEWLGDDDKDARKERSEHTGITLDIDTEMLAKALTKHIARNLAKPMRLRLGKSI